jgi:hypothetical protein
MAYAYPGGKPALRGQWSIHVSGLQELARINRSLRSVRRQIAPIAARRIVSDIRHEMPQRPEGRQQYVQPKPAQSMPPGSLKRNTSWRYTRYGFVVGVFGVPYARALDQGAYFTPHHGFMRFWIPLSLARKLVAEGKMDRVREDRKHPGFQMIRVDHPIRLRGLGFWAKGTRRAREHVEFATAQVMRDLKAREVELVSRDRRRRVVG